VIIDALDLLILAGGCALSGIMAGIDIGRSLSKRELDRAPQLAAETLVELFGSEIVAGRDLMEVARRRALLRKVSGQGVNVSSAITFTCDGTGYRAIVEEAQ
jgi:hypothetical protein